MSNPSFKPNIDWDILYLVVTTITSGFFIKIFLGNSLEGLMFFILFGAPLAVLWSIINIPMWIRALRINKSSGGKIYLAVYSSTFVVGLIFDGWLLYEYLSLYNA